MRSLKASALSVLTAVFALTALLTYAPCAKADFPRGFDGKYELYTTSGDLLGVFNFESYSDSNGQEGTFEFQGRLEQSGKNLTCFGDFEFQTVAVSIDLHCANWVKGHYLMLTPELKSASPKGVHKVLLDDQQLVVLRRAN